MRRVLLMLVVLALSACSSPTKPDVEEDQAKESDFIETKKMGDAGKDIINTTEKKPLQSEDKPSKNPEPNEKPTKAEGENTLAKSDVQRVVVSPGTGQESMTSAGSLDLTYEINNSDFSGSIADVYLLDSDQDLHLVEQQLGVNITTLSLNSGGQRALIVPRHYHGMLAIDEISVNPDQNTYTKTNEYLNVYMAQKDAILLETDISSSSPNILITYTDTDGDYTIQTTPLYSSGDKSLSLDRGFNFSSL